MSSFLERLRAGPRRRLELEEVQRHFYGLFPEVQASPERSARLLEALRELEMQGFVSLPAKGSWEQFGDPPLPRWVTVSAVPDGSQSPRDFSAVPWAPELGFWPLLKPQQLLDLEQINTYLLRRRGSLRPVPIKERSLQIFGDEKRLDAMRTGDTLFAGRLPLATLGAFQVPLPLPYRPADAPGRPVLVVENHNSFWSFGEWNQSAKRYAAVVYGSGEQFRSTGAALGQVLREVQGSGAEYLGDLDVKGVRIPLEFNAAIRDCSPPVRPALDLYRWLLEAGVRRQKNDCRSGALTQAQGWLGENLGRRVHDLWQQGLWIPQEALGFEQLSSDGGQHT